MERPRSFPRSPELERLADAGAWIIAEMTGTGGCQPAVGAAAIEFKDQLLEKDMLEGVAQVKRPVFLYFRKVRFGAHALSPLDGAQNLYGLRLEADDELMMDIGSAPQLRELWVGASGLTVRGLRLLATAKDLCDLNLFDADVGDDVLALVSSLTHLRKLGLSGARITDAGLASLVGLECLDHLSFDSCGVTDDGARHLSKLRSLRSLSLSNTHITDRSLNYVAQLKGLEYLGLQGTGITDDGLSRLAPLDNLRMLTVSETAISDAGLVHLRQLRSLAGVNAFHTRVTERGKRLLPQVEYTLGEAPER